MVEFSLDFRLDCRLDFRLDFRLDLGGASPSDAQGTTSKRTIMAWSSCTVLWQCIG